MYSREINRNPLNRWLVKLTSMVGNKEFKRTSVRKCLRILEEEAQESGSQALMCLQNLKIKIDEELPSITDRHQILRKQSELFKIDFSIKNLNVICPIKNKENCELFYDDKDKACLTEYKYCSSFKDISSKPEPNIYFLSYEELVDLDIQNQK